MTAYSDADRRAPGSLAAAWQASIGSVAAGSLFAVIQTVTMTGVMGAIGGGLIGAGIVWSVATCDWVAVAARAIMEFGKKHAPVIRTSLGTVQELERVLHRVDDVALIMPEEEQSLVRASRAELQQLLDSMAAIQRLFQVIQNLDGAIPRDASVGEVQELVAELQAASEAFCGPDRHSLWARASLEEQWEEYRERAFVKLTVLRCTLTPASLEGPRSRRRCVRRLLDELDRMADELLVTKLSGTET